MLTSNDNGRGASQYEAASKEVEELNIALSGLCDWDGQSVRELLPTLDCINEIAKLPCFGRQERRRILDRIVTLIQEENPDAGDWPKYVHEFHLESGAYGPCNRLEVVTNPSDRLVWVAVDPNGDFVVAHESRKGFRFEVSRFSNYKGKRWKLARQVHYICDACYGGNFSQLAEDLGITVSELVGIAQGSGFKYHDLLMLALIELATQALDEHA